MYFDLISGSLLKDVTMSPSSSPSLSAAAGDKAHDDSQEVKEDLNIDPEENLEHFIAILVESLFLLQKLPEAVEVSLLEAFSLCREFSIFLIHLILADIVCKSYLKLS